ncbi:FkbM family methyltransferase [Variovorax sp. J22R133]|uniref:FkbM family methyltransferase n=1 Tax=Variovorax brevis TaxID=3053503 RepID=UPI002576A7B1|nr:FkbM family methyltransferase [Variovorax sp. J22R133]MDM0115252.1 FkbM family methyltransferase [Variovorax sp. J22R133]
MMYSTLSEKLRAQLMEASAEGSEATISELNSRPVFILAPQSLLGNIHGPAIVAAAKGVVAVVDDFSTASTIHGVERWTSEQFMQRAGQHRGAVAIDFSCEPGARAMFADLCERAGVERKDCVVAQAQLGLVSVYEPAAEYRRKTLERMDDFLRLADRLSDDHSRATLYANLLFRITYDRSHMIATWANPIEEYFSTYATPSTFRLGSNEHFCDCGAYQGPIVSKFLGATRHRYASITAFEPDRPNFEALQQVRPLPLPNFRAVNKAVSSRRQTLRFMETGTMSSYVSADGGVAVQTTKLDDELENLTFLKMDVEGFEAKTLQGGARLLNSQRPRVAACVYHYAHDLLDVMDQFDKSVDDYHFRLRQHNGSYYYDLVLYASPVAGVEAPSWAA